MAWNGPIDNDYTNCDFTRAPWTGGIMTLTHEEVLYVLEQTKIVIENYAPEYGMPEYPDDNTYIVPTYNRDYANNWERGINGDTYAIISGYDPEENILGINEFGIIQPESPIEEPVTEGEPIGETPVEGE